MSISERATNAAIKFGLIFIMMIVLTLVQEFKAEDSEGDESFSPPQEENKLIKGEEARKSVVKLFEKSI